MALLAAKESVQAMIAFKGIARDQMALANTVVQLDEIPEGEVPTSALFFYVSSGPAIHLKEATFAVLMTIQRIAAKIHGDLNSCFF